LRSLKFLARDNPDFAAILRVQPLNYAPRRGLHLLEGIR
jgi:hypothetical protein